MYRTLLMFCEICLATLSELPLRYVVFTNYTIIKFHHSASNYDLRNLISYEKEVDIDSKLDCCSKITDIINDVFVQYHTKLQRIQEQNCKLDWPFRLCYTYLLTPWCRVLEKLVCIVVVVLCVLL